MAKPSPTPGAIAALLAAPSPASPADVPEAVVQVVDLKPIGSSTSRFTFMASDGKMKLKAMLPTHFASEIQSGNLKNLGLIRILDYTCNSIPNQTEKALIVTKCEVVLAVLDEEVKADAGASQKEEASIPDKTEQKQLEQPMITLKPKTEGVVMSASQIVNEERGRAAPAARLAISRRVHPLVSLNPYQGNWTIKVRVTRKANLRTYSNARGEGCVFDMELTDEDGTQIQATMFNQAAKKFYPVFELGKVYFISKGSLRVANRQYKTVENDYELTLNENAVVEEALGESSIPAMKFNFVKIDQLGPYVNGRDLIDVMGVVQSVSSTMSVRRKSDNETVPKRDITIADESKKTVTMSLWGDLATGVGQELLDIADAKPTVAVKCVKVGDFQGLSLSTVGKSTVIVNPDLPEAKQLRSWYETEGKTTSMSSVAADMGVAPRSGAFSMYADRVSLSHITSDPTLGQEKPVFFSVFAYISLIKPDQAMWYRACKTCNKKVVEAVGSGYWCEGCQKNDDQCALRYIMVMKVSDPTGEAWLSVFNEQAEKILGCTADELNNIKVEDGEDKYHMKLKEVTWVPHLFRVSVTQNEYMNEKRQRITVRAEAPVDFAAEASYIMEEIGKLTV